MDGTGLTKEWGVVRPVRFRDDVFSVVKLIASKRRHIDIQDIRLQMVASRLKREEIRMGAVHRSISLDREETQREILLTKAEQLVRVLRATKILEREHDRQTFRATANAMKLSSIMRTSDERSGSYFLNLLLNSRYSIYWNFLVQLASVDQLQIPKEYSKRDKTLAAYLRSREFYLDSWSFYILRDFFYEFDLLNFVIDQAGMKIFPLYRIGPDKKYRLKVRGPSSVLSYWPRIRLGDFIKKVVDVYLEETGRKWNRVVDLLTVREKDSELHRMPERLFDNLITLAARRQRYPRIVLSVGTPMELRNLGSYGIKSLHLPQSKSGLPYLYIRIDPGGN